MTLKSQKGNAVVEFAVSLLFIIPVIIGIIDVCVMLTNYQKLEQSVREGVRTASRLPILTEDVNFVDHDTTANLASCSSITPPTPSATLDCGHVLMHSRVRAVLRHENLIGFEVVQRIDPATGLPIPAVVIESLFCPLPDPSSTVVLTNCAPGATEDTIVVRATGTYNGFFGNWPLTASYQGPWLFQNVSTP